MCLLFYLSFIIYWAKLQIVILQKVNISPLPRFIEYSSDTRDNWNIIVYHMDGGLYSILVVCLVFCPADHKLVIAWHILWNYYYCLFCKILISLEAMVITYLIHSLYNEISFKLFQIAFSHLSSSTTVKFENTNLAV